MKALTLVALALCNPLSAADDAPALSSPAEQKILAAKASLEDGAPESAELNRLAMALSYRARETHDPKYYDKALDAVAQSLELDPDNYEARRAQTWAMLGKHEFAEALDMAKALVARFPDDVMANGMLADANAELGQYDEAEKAVQWMLDMHPGNVPGLTRAAYLREIYGDVDGAVELMLQAFHRMPGHEVEQRAWVLCQLSHLHFQSGQLETAIQFATKALGLFPRYHYALAALGHAHMAMENFGDAEDAYRTLCEVAPHPENYYLLAKALMHAGKQAEADMNYERFREKALFESVLADNANPQLIEYFIDVANKPAEAIRIAELEIARKRNVFALDAYAWALHASGDYAKAHEVIREALDVGTKDVKLLYHSEVIAAAASDVDNS